MFILPFFERSDGNRPPRCVMLNLMQASRDPAVWGDDAEYTLATLMATDGHADGARCVQNALPWPQRLLLEAMLIVPEEH